MSVVSGTRRTIAAHSDYRDAERAVGWLSDRGFPVERIAIVGSGLRTVEQVAGRLTTGRAALAGAGQGALAGLLFALLFGLFFNGPAFFGLLVYSVILGAIFGALLRALAQAAMGGRRNFASVSTTSAERYQVQADESVAAQAQQPLSTLPSTRA